jgi:predicted 3-demethylubiquinone-9 3-methyltransferase (glyoxalase superfamily)
MPTIHPFLWFRTEAEEARDFYLSVFKTGRALESLRFPGTASGSGKTVPVSTFDFELDGMRVTALNAGSHPPFNESLSFYVETEDQAETDYYYSALTAGGGQEKPCGWLVDKYGVYWQVAPKILPRLTSDPDRAKAERAMQAMYKMTRIVIADLEAAYAGKA